MGEVGEVEAVEVELLGLQCPPQVLLHSLKWKDQASILRICHQVGEVEVGEVGAVGEVLTSSPPQV